MNKIFLYLLLVAIFTGCSNHKTETITITRGPIQLHPENPHYFQYKDKTLVLITSAEHYGAVLNLDFDYKLYLKTLAEEGMNYTRVFTGTYFEIYGESFSIQHNTLAPQKGRVITPWAKKEDPSGKPVYDLSSWNTAYFERLKNFMQLASTYDIIVEVTLFSSIYNEGHWEICPQNPANNINLNQDMAYKNAQIINNGGLFPFQANYVRKMVQELNEFDNFFFEIQNEPWPDRQLPAYNIVNKEELILDDWGLKADFGDEESLAWQDSLASIINSEETKLDKKHLIAQNYTNYKAPIPWVSDHISIINFHYAWPEAVEWNYHYDKVIGFDESGFAGSGDKVYRRQAWKFMLSGGGLFNNLDYSFYVGNEDGLGKNDAPGGGSKTLRMQLNTLHDFLDSFELEKLYPNYICIQKSPGLIPFVLSDNNKSYAIYLRAVGTKNTVLHLKTDNGNYMIQTLNTIAGTFNNPKTIEATNGILKIDITIPNGELALKIHKE